METLQLLRTLSEARGPSGLERAATDVIADLWQPFVDSIAVDRLGSLVATKNGSGTAPRPRLMLSAHCDEIALMVTDVVEANGFGFLRVTAVGGVDIRHLYSQRVVVHGREDIPGVLASLPTRLLPEDRRSGAYGFEDLMVDVGLSAESTRDLIRIGDFVTFDQQLVELVNGRVAGKALDNRASVAAVTICLEQLHGREHVWDVLAVASSQEETRLLGAATSAYRLQPDAAVALDVSYATSYNAKDSINVELGSGPMIDQCINIHPGINKALIDAAKALEIKFTHVGYGGNSGTDAQYIQIARAGIPTGLLSIPQRYMHTMVETVDIKDVERTGRLLAEFVVRLSADFIDTISAEMLEA
ncbi:MAG: M20/M25/M40 family metallo-hydrolase [Anaerolineae bacterium]|nr:M20/M25/M40 family metallo-hydrolase [Anaerolineae bacterium]